MLQTKIGGVSSKGQILIPMKKKNPIEAAYGMIADVGSNHSWTKELVEERRAEVARGK